MTRFLPYARGICLFLPAIISRGWAAGPDVPSSGFDASRYTSLWSSSPFAVASPKISSDTEYSLVGLAQFDGTAYACLIDKQNQEHFLLSNRAPQEGLTLVSISPAGQPTRSAMIQKGGQLLSLELESAPGNPALLQRSMIAPQPVKAALSTLPHPPCPPQGSLPVPFQVPTPGVVSLNAQQQEQIDGLRQTFIEELGPYPDPHELGYTQRWKEAQASTDEAMRTLLGQELFNRYQGAAQSP